MEPRILSLPEKKLIGKSLRMTFAQNKTFELWQSFMLQRKEITNNLTTELISMQIFDVSLDFQDFNFNTEFEKWAAVEVSDFALIPNGMRTHTLSGGLYAVFIHKGAASDFNKTFQFIFKTWLPNSEYLLDKREHFELLGNKYKNENPDSEEEVWIPVKPRD